MQKIVIDTNVIVSALIQKSYPFLIISELLFENKIKLCVSEELISEYIDVLHRPKFSRFPNFVENAKIVITDIGLKAELYHPKTKINVNSDQDDNMIIELAVESNADFIITGNTNDFTMKSYKNTKIVTPKEYWENYKPF